MAKPAVWIAALGLSALGASTANAQSMTLTSSDIKEGATITNEQVFNGFGCTGGNLSPALSWSGAPSGTETFYEVDASNHILSTLGTISLDGSAQAAFQDSALSAGAHDIARSLHEAVGELRDVHEPVLVHPDVDERGLEQHARRAHLRVPVVALRHGRRELRGDRWCDDARELELACSTALAARAEGEHEKDQRVFSRRTPACTREAHPFLTTPLRSH